MHERAHDVLRRCTRPAGAGGLHTHSGQLVSRCCGSHLVGCHGLGHQAAAVGMQGSNVGGHDWRFFLWVEAQKMTDDEREQLIDGIGQAIAMALAAYHAHGGTGADRLHGAAHTMEFVAETERVSPDASLMLLAAADALRHFIPR